MARHRRGSSKHYLVIAGLMFCVVILPRFGDVIIGHLKPTDGCNITAIVDGDTVTIDCPETGEERARILGYDTAEIDAQCFQEWQLATRAKWALRWAVWSANKITTQKTRQDRYDRALINVDIDGRDVASILIDAGLARSYSGGKRGGWCAG